MTNSVSACGLHIVTGALVAIAIGVPAHAQTLPAEAHGAVTFNYGLDASLLYLSAFGRPDAAALTPTFAAAPAQVATPRTIGLRKLAMHGSWRAVSGGELNVTLRPDAETRPATADGVHREVDTRSGTPYRGEASVQLLDAYDVSVGVGAGLTTSLGVFSTVAPTRASYAPIADFGLAVRFPTKFSALKLRWQRESVAPDRAIEVQPSTFVADLFVMQGDDDRVETVGRGELFDEGPVAKDPYQGGAMHLGYAPSRRGDIGLVVGTNDAPETGGRRTEVYGQLVGSVTYPLLARQGKLTVDVRYATEKWRGDSLALKPRQQQSVGLTHATGLTSAAFWLLGAHWGLSERQAAVVTDIATQTGYQIETGWAAELADGIGMQLMATHERREEEDEASGPRGAFVNEEGDSRKTLRRFALEISYAINDNG
jgi:hypothetical protein